MQVQVIDRKMFFVQIGLFFVAFLALGQSQRLTMTTDAPWIWDDDSTSNENPFGSTRSPNTIPTTQSIQFTTPNRRDQPTPRTCPGCPRTPQFNPVCGSDMATYDNPTAVACANMCGPKIEILFYAACQPTA